MRVIRNIFFRVIWFFFSFFEKVYWTAWREIQKQRFIRCGNNVSIGRGCYFTNATISIGEDVYIGPGCRFQSTKSKILIGNHVMFGPDVSVHGGNHRIDIIGRYMKDITLEDKLPENDLEIVISDDVWIGAGAIILNGVNIGKGSIIGAGSVITRAVPPYTIVVGSRPQQTFQRFDTEQILKHLQLINHSEESKKE